MKNEVNSYVKQFYVETEEEMNLIERAFEAGEYRCYRVQTACHCDSANNSRNGLLVLDCDEARLEVIRCTTCEKRRLRQEQSE